MDWLKALLEKAVITDGKLDIEGLMKSIKEEFPKNAVPKTEFNALNEAKKALDEQITERDKQLETLKAAAKGNEELQAEVEKLQDENAKTKEAHEKEVKALKFDHAIEARLAKEGAVNALAVKALLDTGKISLDGENLIGIDEQLKALRETEKWAFGDKSAVPGAGGNPPGPPPSKDFKDMTSEERLELKKSNPTLYQSLREKYMKG